MQFWSGAAAHPYLLDKLCLSKLAATNMLTPLQKRDIQFEKRLRDFLQREFGDIRRRQQLLLDMTGLEQRLGIADAIDFERRHGIPRGRIDQLEDDTWIHLSRAHLLRLLSLEHDVQSHDPQFRFLRVVPDPIWQTFETPAIGFTGEDLRGHQVSTDYHLLGAFAAAGISFQKPDGVDIVDAMQKTNCIFVGSPKCNKHTESAIEALWPEETPPLRFFWHDWPVGRAEGRVSKKGERKIDFVNHRDQREAAVDRSPDRPVGILIICRSPMATTEKVTTIIAAGSSKFGTLQIVEDVLSGAVYVWSSQLVNGKPSVFILKPRARGKRWYNIDGERELAQKLAQRRQERSVKTT